MRAVTFSRKEDATHKEEIGFIAEEVAEHFSQVIAHDEDGEIHTVRYDLMTAVLLAGLKEQMQIIKSLRAELDELKARA